MSLQVYHAAYATVCTAAYEKTHFLHFLLTHCFYQASADSHQQCVLYCMQIFAAALAVQTSLTAVVDLKEDGWGHEGRCSGYSASAGASVSCYY